MAPTGGRSSYYTTGRPSDVTPRVWSIGRSVCVCGRAGVNKIAPCSVRSISDGGQVPRSLLSVAMITVLVAFKSELGIETACLCALH